MNDGTLDTSHTKPRRHDLSYADQQELLAFIEKRRWFESKLESLKALAPVYPFVHPVLLPDPASTAGYVRAGAESSEWRLPNKAQLAAWVNERNALVDEVERFDDGDMERMKDKTRQMTRVPLTQPSTDLVEVTLDLILLIDQLMQVLRSRGSILELTSLRLQWDDLRYEVKRESESVATDIEHVVAEAQAWLPGAVGASRWEPRRRGSELSAPASPQIPQSSSAGSIASQASASVPMTPPLGSTHAPSSPNRAPSPTKQPGSPTKPHNVPRSALHVSILRSQLVGLQTRHRNLQYNLVKRSGAILDKMIDQAGRLKDLGGVDGPLLDESGERQHAIPDALIDLQEELEARATDIGARVTWCSSFEQQCRKGHDHFSRSARAQKASTDFLDEIRSALAQPASSSKHAELAQMYAQARNLLPPELDAESLPMPSHPAFPSKDDHNQAVFAALSEARGGAERDLELGGRVLAYYASLLKSRQALQAQHERVQTLRDQLQQAIKRLEDGSETAPRPMLSTVARDGGEHSPWLEHVPLWTEQGDMTVRAATDAHETTVLAVMQYRKAMSNAPLAVKPYLPSNGVPDDLGGLVDDDSQDLITLGRECAALAKRARADADALPLILNVRQTSAEVSEKTKTLRGDIVRAINLAAWSTHSPMSLPTTLSEDLSRIEELASDYDSDMARLREMPGTSEAITPLESTLEGARQEVSEARRELDVFRRVSHQAQTVHELQREAERLVDQLEAAAEAMPQAEADASDATLAGLRSQVSQWLDVIVPLVPLVSDHEPSTSAYPSNDDQRTANGPLTPPLTPTTDRDDQSSGIMTAMPDLAALDERVRREVNHQSARVSASLARLAGMHDRLAFERWAAPVRRATESLESAKQELQATLSGLMDGLGHLGSKNQQTRHDQAVESIRSGAEALGKHAATVQSLVCDLNEVLAAETSSGMDMRKAADVFSSADLAREAALEQIDKAEKWQRQLEDVVARSLLERSVTPAPDSLDEAPKTPEQLQKKLRSLDGGLDALELEAIVHPSPAQLRATPKARRLPSSTDAKKLTKAFTSIADTARSIARSQPNSPEVQRLLDKVASQGSLVPDLEGLGLVGDAAKVCDEAFSRLLDTVDAGRRDETVAAELEAQDAVRALQEVAEPLLGDSRVALEKRRISNAWRELRSVAENEDESIATSSVAGSTAGSLSMGSSVTVTSRVPERSTAQARKRLSWSTTPAQRASSLRTSTTSFETLKPSGPGLGTPTPSRVSNADKGRLTMGHMGRARPSLDGGNPFTPNPKTPGKPRHSLPSRPSTTGRTITPTVPMPFRLSRSTSSKTGLAEKLADAAPRKPRASEPARPATSAITSRPSFTGRRSSSSANMAGLSRSNSIVSVANAGREGMPNSSSNGAVKTRSNSDNSLARTMSRSNSSGNMALSRSSSNVNVTKAGLSRSNSTANVSNLARSDSKTRPSPRPKPKSKLDDAVERVLAGLDVRVPMVPAGRRAPVEWKDESGRYWIGIGPRARMCFCRILRSRTVMVRVGGGWVELSRYLLDHFEDIEPDSLDASVLSHHNKPGLTAAEGAWNNTPITVTSSSLSQSQHGPSNGLKTNSTSAVRSPKTPRASLPAFPFTVQPENATTPLPLRAASLSPHKSPGGVSPGPGLSPGAVVVGPGSPLLPLQFLRKAGESPGQRDKEREALKRSMRSPSTSMASIAEGRRAEREKSAPT